MHADARAIERENARTHMHRMMMRTCAHMQIRDATQTEGVKPKCRKRERERERERRWFVLKRPRRDINGGSETEVTVTSKRHAQAERAKR